MPNDKLKSAFQAAGLTVEEFAEIVGVDPKSVGRWLAGASTPYPRHRASIARALDLPEDELWPENTPPPAREPATDEPPAAGDVAASWGNQDNDPRAGDPLGLL